MIPGSALLTLARDNKWEDLKQAVENGAPVEYGNQVRIMHHCKSKSLKKSYYATE